MLTKLIDEFDEWREEKGQPLNVEMEGLPWNKGLVVSRENFVGDRSLFFHSLRCLIFLDESFPCRFVRGRECTMSFLSLQCNSNIKQMNDAVCKYRQILFSYYNFKMPIQLSNQMIQIIIMILNYQKAFKFYYAN